MENRCVIVDYFQVLPHLTPSKRARVIELQRRLSSRSDVPNGYSGGAVSQSTTPSVAVTHSNEQANLKQELDDTVAAECIFCGDAMIRSVPLRIMVGA